MGGDRASAAAPVGEGASPDYGLAGSVRQDMLGEYGLPVFHVVFPGPELVWQVAGQEILRARQEPAS